MTVLVIYRQTVVLNGLYLMINLNQSPGENGNRILIVEDESLVAWDIEQMLSDNGFGSVTSPSLRGARAALEEQGRRISLAIVDLKLEDGCGTELVEWILHRGIPTLVVTGYGNFSHPRVPVLYKPFLSEELIRIVRSLL